MHDWCLRQVDSLSQPTYLFHAAECKINDYFVNLNPEMENLTATVISVDYDMAVVELDVAEATCDSCRLASVCSRPESSRCRFEAWVEPSECIVPGMKVGVSARNFSWRRAVLLGLAVPLALMIVSAIAASWARLSDASTAIVSIAVPAGFYLLLYLLRRRIFRRSGLICHRLAFSKK